MTDVLERIISVSNDYLWSYVLVVLLVGLGVYFSFKTRFVQIRYFKETIKILFEKSEIAEDGKKKVSSFGAFCIGSASRIGTGNIAGVAIAVSVGGPGAVFWMWAMSIFGAASAFIESTLAQIYKVKDKEGYKGGPAYYMQQGLKSRAMGIVFATLTILCFGLAITSVQSNTIAISLKHTFGINPMWTGIALVLLTACVIFGGTRRIATFSQAIVPILSFVYLGIAAYITLMHIGELPGLLKTIVMSAFGFNEAFGGALGTVVSTGIKRGLFANEAGLGSAPNAAASASTSHPAKQGLLQAFGVLTDTLLICTASAFIVLFSDAWQTQNLTGIELATVSMEQNIGSIANILMSVTIFLFAFSSVIGNYYYGQTNLDFIKEGKGITLIYKFLLLGMVMMGSVASLAFVWELADLFMGLMALTNLIAITLLAKIAFSALKDYDKQVKESTEVVFFAEDIGITNTEAWLREEEKTK